MTTKWPLICESCGTEVWVGGLFGGRCGPCNRQHTVVTLLRSAGVLDDLLGNAPSEPSRTVGQRELGDFA